MVLHGDPPKDANHISPRGVGEDKETAANAIETLPDTWRQSKITGAASGAEYEPYGVGVAESLQQGLASAHGRYELDPRARLRTCLADCPYPCGWHHSPRALERLPATRGAACFT